LPDGDFISSTSLLAANRQLPSRAWSIGWNAVVIVHRFHPISNLFPSFFHTYRVVKSKIKNGILNLKNTNHFLSNERNNKMNISLRLTRPQTIQVNFAPLIAFFTRLVARIPRFTSPSDDIAALRYLFDKYNGEID
jgi:hypothetical protein